MRTPLSDQLGIDLPVFAFSHCRDVVAEVSRAGGMGVLGAGYFDAAQLEAELAWLDAHVGEHNYGVDIMLPQGEDTTDVPDPRAQAEALLAQVPAGHVAFAERLLGEHGVPAWPEADEPPPLLGWTAATVMPLLEVSLAHPKCRLIANALGAPPVAVVERIHASGRLVAGLCGRVSQAARHQAAGVDMLVAVGGEGGGHVGEVGSIVLWPQVVDAVAPLPVVAAGGIASGRQIAAALACGAQGVWTGSLWLTVAESGVQPAQRESYLAAGSEDTVRTRSWTGKPSRMLRNDWTEAWAAADAPPTLGMPLQGMATADAMRRVERYAGVAGAQAVACNPVGQVIGQITQVETCRQVMQRLQEEYLEAIAGLLPPD